MRWRWGRFGTTLFVGSLANGLAAGWAQDGSRYMTQPLVRLAVVVGIYAVAATLVYVCFVDE